MWTLSARTVCRECEEIGPFYTPQSMGPLQVHEGANVYQAQLVEGMQRVDQLLSREMERVDAILSLEGKEDVQGNLQLSVGEGVWEAEGYESMDTDSLDEAMEWEEQGPTRQSMSGGAIMGEADRLKWIRFIRRLRFLWMDEDFNRLQEIFHYWKVLSWRRISAVRKLRRAMNMLRQRVQTKRMRRSAPLHLTSSMKRRTFRRLERVIGIRDQALRAYVSAAQVRTLRQCRVGFLALRATRDHVKKIRHVQCRHSWYLLKEHHRLWRRAQQVNRFQEGRSKQLVARHLHAWKRLHKAMRFRRRRLGRLLAAFRSMRQERQERLEGLLRRHLQSRALKTWCTAYSTAVASCALADQAFQRRVFRRCLERWRQCSGGHAVLKLLGRVADLYWYKSKARRGLLLLRLACEKKLMERRNMQEASARCARRARPRTLSRWRQVASAEAATDHARVQQARARTARRLATETFKALHAYSLDTARKRSALHKAVGYWRVRRLVLIVRRWRERAQAQTALRRAYSLAALMHEGSSFGEALRAWRAGVSVREERRAMVQLALEVWQRRGKARGIRAWSATCRTRAAEVRRAKLADLYIQRRALSLLQHRQRQARSRREVERRRISLGEVWQRRMGLSVAWAQLREETQAQTTHRTHLLCAQQWGASRSIKAALWRLRWTATCERKARLLQESAARVWEREKARMMRTAWILWISHLRSIHRRKAASVVVQRRRQRGILKQCFVWWMGHYKERSVERQGQDMAVLWARGRQAKYALQALRGAAVEGRWTRQAMAMSSKTAATFLLRSCMPRLERAAVNRRMARELASAAVDHCVSARLSRALTSLQLAACRGQRKRDAQALVHATRTRAGFQWFYTAVRRQVARTQRVRRSMVLAERACRRLAQARVLERWLSVYHQTTRFRRVRDLTRAWQLASFWIHWRTARHHAQVVQGFQQCRQLRRSRQVLEAWRALSAAQASRRAVFVSRQADRARRGVLLAWREVAKVRRGVRARAAVIAHSQEQALLRALLYQWGQRAAEVGRERWVLCSMQAFQQQAYLRRWRERTLIAMAARMVRIRRQAKGMSRLRLCALAGRGRRAAQAVQLLLGLRRFKRGVLDCRRSRMAKLRARTLCLRAERHELSCYVHRWASWVEAERAQAAAERTAQVRRATLSRCFAGWATLVQHKSMARSWLQRQHRQRLEHHANHADVLSN